MVKGWDTIRRPTFSFFRPGILGHTWIYIETQNAIARSGSEDRENRAKRPGSRT